MKDSDFKPTILASNCRFCGSVPRYHSRRVTFGHGEYPLCAFVICDVCGIRTDDFIIDGFYGCLDSPNTPIYVWNRYFGKG